MNKYEYEHIHSSACGKTKENKNHDFPPISIIEEAEAKGFSKMNEYTYVVCEDGLMEVKVSIQNGVGFNVYADLYRKTA